MSFQYLFGTWTERYDDDFNSSGQLEHIYCASGPGLAENCLPDRINSPLGGLYTTARNTWLVRWGMTNAQVVAESGPGANPWTLTLSVPVLGYLYDPATGDPLPGPGPVGGVGGPWDEDGSGLGPTGPDGSSTPPPPPPAPYGGCDGMRYLQLSGLPVTRPVQPNTWVNGHLIPGCNGMAAHARLWQLTYPQNAEGTGLDFSQPPTRFQQGLPDPTPDGTVLWSGVGISGLNLELEVLPLTVDGVTYTPTQRYTNVPTGCGEAGVPVQYVPQPGPGLLLDPVRAQLTPEQGSLTYPPHAPLTVGAAYRIGVQTNPTQSVQTLWITSGEPADAGLITYRTETLLARLARLTPWPAGVTIPGPWPTAQGALTALLDALHALEGWGDWFGWEDLPPLPLADGTDLAVERIEVPAGLNALELLRRVTAPFPVTVQASQWGRLALIGAGGAPLTLTDDDLLTVTVGPLDASGVINACTVISGGVSTPYAPDALPPEVALSRAAYGVRSMVLELPLVVSPQAAAVLAGQVAQARASPVQVCTVTQGAPYRVTAKELGHLVTVPEGAGRVTTWVYSEAHTPQQSQSSSAYTLAVPQRLIDRPQPLADGTFTVPTTEDRFDVAQWDAAPLTP